MELLIPVGALALAAAAAARASEAVLAFARGRSFRRRTGGLERRLEALRRLEAGRSRLISVVAHDVRTPLGAVRGFGRMLAGQPLTPDSRRYVRYILRGADQIGRLAADLTDLTLLESGRLSVVKSRFPLSALLEDVLAPAAAAARERGVRLELGPRRAPPGLRLLGDRGRLAQALGNLLHNAVKFTPEGGRVRVSTAAGGGRVLLAVGDTGPGIHPGERERVFERFYQSRFQPEAERRRGRGLGLAIAHEIVVRGHGGSIGVRSEGLGRGSTFWIALRLALLLAACAASPAAAEGPAAQRALYEQALERKAQGALDLLLGPGRAHVAVAAVLDLGWVERVDIEDPGPPRVSGHGYLWQEPPGQGGPELLPGIPAPAARAPPPPRSHERRLRPAPSPVRRLEASLLIDERLKGSRGDEAAQLAARVLGLRPPRGDALSVTYARFAPFWRGPEGIARLGRWLLLAAFTLAALWAARSWMARLSAPIEELARLQRQELESSLATPRGAEGAGPAPEPFRVRPEEARRLAEILRGQRPEALALVAAGLSSEAQKEFVARLEPSARADVAAAFPEARRTDPARLALLGREIERRLAREAARPRPDVPAEAEPEVTHG